ncbi:RES domain-containing protein [Terriglobus albidus]|uniref:RES domain-containing protein n=1 Tax=Terriglobus albidus TaxID=1592106 RepID=A0A5B9E542_9BACT|nr:RES domain-containing protein [Terriglobus albidus]QEE26684.1 RES domain-containing protein [Terriglobus albidus]
MIAYRIADARHPIYDGTGAMLHGGRWNSVGQRVIYAAESYAGAMLEVLVHANLSIPPKHHQVVRITIPDSIKVETLLPSQLPFWDAEDVTEARSVGDRWLKEMRSAVLSVPSVVTEGREKNILINPLHPDFPRIIASIPEPVHWDHRLFGGRDVPSARGGAPE